MDSRYEGRGDQPMAPKRVSRFLRGSHTMEVRSHNDEDNDPPNSRAITYDALNVGLGGIGKIKGLYLAAGARAGCLTVLNFEQLHCSVYGPTSADIRAECLTVFYFEQLYCSIYGPTSGIYDERSCFFHICTNEALDVIRWAPTNNNEVYCASYRRKRIRLYDIDSAMPEPIRTLERAGVGSRKNGFSDMHFHQKALQGRY